MRGGRPDGDDVACADSLLGLEVHRDTIAVARAVGQAPPEQAGHSAPVGVRTWSRSTSMNAPPQCDGRFAVGILRKSSRRSATGGAVSPLLPSALGRSCQDKAPHLADHLGRTVPEAVEPACHRRDHGSARALDSLLPRWRAVMKVQTFGVDISARWFDVPPPFHLGLASA
jgi:hypothetical protein